MKTSGGIGTSRVEAFSDGVLVIFSIEKGGIPIFLSVGSNFLLSPSLKKPTE
jgi:hypothetical protein